ncbi:hypothetical protein [Streptococcus mitis]|uniref:hypothetical protein n=1 Tax=Streptococcus mitis TaxID=28037 RepID=UPI00398BF048
MSNIIIQGEVKYKKFTKKKFILLATSFFSFGFATTASVGSETTAIPVLYPIIDLWKYGVSDSYGYSNYFVSSSNNISSESSVTNIFGTLKFTIKKIIDGHFQAKNLK